MGKDKDNLLKEKVTNDNVFLLLMKTLSLCIQCVSMLLADTIKGYYSGGLYLCITGDSNFWML